MRLGLSLEERCPVGFARDGQENLKKSADELN